VLLWVNTVDFEKRPDGACNLSIYRHADFCLLRSSGIWFEILERQESAEVVENPADVICWTGVAFASKARKRCF